MAMGPGKFDNIYARLNVELDRLQRAGIPEQLISNFRTELLKYKPVEEPPIYAAGTATTPYQIAFNRYEGFKRGELTWEFFLKAWDECSPADQEALNELINNQESE